MPPRRKNKSYCIVCGDELKLNHKNGKYNKKFCSNNCSHGYFSGENNGNFKQGHFIDSLGYHWIRVIGHPKSTNTGYVKRATLVMENKIQRYLKDGEAVHHINRDKGDDGINNLQLVTQQEHSKIHFGQPRPNRRIREYFKIAPTNVIVGKEINVGKSYRHLIGNICQSCHKPYWARLDRQKNYCSIKCSWINRKNTSIF